MHMHPDDVYFNSVCIFKLCVIYNIHFFLSFNIRPFNQAYSIKGDSLFRFTTEQPMQKQFILHFFQINDIHSMAWHACLACK